jgi:hypothetical protein
MSENARLTVLQAVVIPHYGVIANVIQMATHYRVNESSTKFIPGDIAMAGKSIELQPLLVSFTE